MEYPQRIVKEPGNTYIYTLLNLLTKNMEADKVDKFLLANESKFPDYEIPIHKLLNLPPEKETLLENTHFRSPGIILLLSIFLGVTGLDRFLIGNIGKGFGKLLTAGGLGIWYIVDWFLITGATKRYNMNKLMAILS